MAPLFLFGDWIAWRKCCVMPVSNGRHFYAVGTAFQTLLA